MVYNLRDRLRSGPAAVWSVPGPLPGAPVGFAGAHGLVPPGVACPGRIAGKRAPGAVDWGKPDIISGNQGVVPEPMEMADGRNLGADPEAFNQEISMETIVSQAPEGLFIWGSASWGVDTLLRDPNRQATPAVKNRRVFKTTRVSTWSSRVVVPAWWMARCLHPRPVSEADVPEAAHRIYRECLGIPLASLP